MSVPIFDIDGVCKRFATTVALREVTLDVTQGETTVLIGPSGCGKSTLMRIMLGLITPDEGSVRFEGQDLMANRLNDLRQKMGYVVQDGGLFPHLTAEGNVTLMARYLKWGASRIRERLTELSELTQFPIDGLGRYPIELSGGQRQRVSLMRALMLDPDVLLLDEPLGALDPIIRRGLQEQLRSIFSSLGKTVVIVTHDLAEAGFFADRIVLMRDGSIVQSGSINELINDPNEPFVSDFINAQRYDIGASDEAVLS